MVSPGILIHNRLYLNRLARRAGVALVLGERGPVYLLGKYGLVLRCIYDQVIRRVSPLDNPIEFIY